VSRPAGISPAAVSVPSRSVFSRLVQIATTGAALARIGAIWSLIAQIGIDVDQGYGQAF